MIKTLKNGVRIIFEKDENIRSCSLGIWVVNGSRFEEARVNGISHFIEHMMFKGTETRKAVEIANEMDLIGGGVNAFTTKECTCYYVKTLDMHLNKAIDILTDMFFNSKFLDKDIDLERTVIEEEISMYEDQPEDVCFEQLLEKIYRDNPLGKPVLGSRETLKNINSKEIKDFIASNYTANNIIVSICGSFDEKHIEKIEKIFESVENKPAPLYIQAKYQKTYTLIKRDIEQNHIAIGFDSINISNQDRFALQVMSSIFGSGMSSRLFQKVREENGLCYTISSFNSPNMDTGAFVIYTALSKNTEEKALGLIKDVTNDFLENEITEEEIFRAREQIKTNILMGLENSSSRMNFYARSLIFQGKILTSDEIIKYYDEVTKDDVIRLAKKILVFSEASICVVGDVSNEQVYQKFLS